MKESNPAFEKTFQMDKGHLLNQNFLDLIGSHNSQLQLFSKNLPDTDEEVTFTTSTKIGNTQTIIIEWYLKLNQNHSEIFCFGINITQRIEEKLKLESSERRFRSFFENAIGLMSMHDMEGNIIAVNEKGRETLQYSAEEVERLNLKDLVPQKTGLFWSNISNESTKVRKISEL